MHMTRFFPQVNGVSFQRNSGADRRGGVVYVAEDGTRLRSISAVETYIVRVGLKEQLPACLGLFDFSSAANDPAPSKESDEQMSSSDTPCKRTESMDDPIDPSSNEPLRARRKRARRSPSPPQSASTESAAAPDPASSGAAAVSVEERAPPRIAGRRGARAEPAKQSSEAAPVAAPAKGGGGAATATATANQAAAEEVALCVRACVRA
jgi:hypothetical protein